MSKGLTPGATLPDFELPDDTGTKHRLSDLQGDKGRAARAAVIVGQMPAASGAGSHRGRSHPAAGR